MIDDDMFEEKFGVSVRFRTASVADDIAFEIFQNKLKSIGLGRMSPTDLAAIRDQAGLVAAGVTIAKHVGKDFYHALHERPLVAGEMRSHGPRRMIELMEGELYNDVSIGLEDLEIPPFLGMLISETDDWPSRFWERLLDLRERHKKFRLNIGKYQINWRNSTRGDQRKLKLEFDRAWSSLLKKEEHVLETRVSHVTLNALLSVGKSLAKDAIALDKFDQPISRVGGLVTLWNDMESIVPAHRGREIISKHCVDIASPAQWSEILSNVSSANSAAALSKDAN